MRLYIMQMGLYTPVEYPVPFAAYLIQTDDGKNVLVDTGVDERYVAAIFNDQWENLIKVEPSDQILNQLKALSLTPDDIDYVIATHFDEDHCGHNFLFRKAEFIVQKSHYELAKLGKEARFETCRSCWDRPELIYRQIEGDITLLPGIDLIMTNGHVVGHQSVIVHLPNTGAVLLAVDAIRDGDMLEPGIDPRTKSMFDMDGEELIVGVEKIKSLMTKEQVQLSVFGHDGKRWQSLKKSPAYYD